VIPRASNGQFVSDLTQNDFQILEDGVPQQVASMVLVHGGRVFNILQPPAPSSSPPVEGLILPALRPRDPTASRIFIVLVDDLHFTAIETPYVRALLKKVVGNLFHEGDMFAMFSTGPSSLEIPLSYDRVLLEEGISRVAGHGMSYRDIMDGRDGSLGPQGLRHNAHVAFKTAFELLGNLEKVRDRRKALILVSNGYDFDPFPEGRRGTDQVFGGRYGSPWADPDRGDRFLQLERQGNRFADGDLAAEMAALNERAPLDLRVNMVRSNRESVLARLRADGFDAKPTPFARSGVRLVDARQIDAHPLYRDGLIEIQDEGSQIVAALVGAQAGERIIDYCAGAGGKALALAAVMGDHGEIIACDTSSARLRKMAPRLARAGVKIVHPRSMEEAGVQGKFDRVLLDVPCSGIGAWRRRPEARWLLSEDKLIEYNDLQDDLLVKGAMITAKNGALVYATCSVLKSEGEDRIASFLERVPGFEVVDADQIWPKLLDGVRPDQGSFVNLSPATSGTDGFFVAVLRNTT